MTQGIQKRIHKSGIVSYRVQIRQNDGFPPKSKSFSTFQEAKDWQIDEKARRRRRIYFAEQENKKHTLAELIDRYITIILPTKPKDARNAKRQLEWWKTKIGKYALHTISADLVAQYRKELSEGITSKGIKRSSSTVNRYLSILSSVMTYGVRDFG